LSAGAWLYENPHATPRAYFASEVATVHGIDATRDALRAFDDDAIGRRALVDGPVPPQIGRGVIKRAAYAPRLVELGVASEEGPALLVLNDRFDPSWKATVDGRPAPIVRTNGIVRGVFVPEGAHEVRFFYDVPREVWLGLGLAIGGILFAAFA